MRGRSFQFFELLGRSMHFDTGKIGHLQHFLQERADRDCRAAPLKI
jgi:hypothetical protein